MKVRGYKDSDGVKHFNITHGGKSYDARRVGQKFECMGRVDTLKNIKTMIESADVGDTPTSNDDEYVIEPPTPVGEYNRQTYDCVDPCALLILLLAGEITKEDPELRRTLDAFAWIEDGQHNIVASKRELSRARSFGPQKPSVDTEHQHTPDSCPTSQQSDSGCTQLQRDLIRLQNLEDGTATA